MAFTEMPPILRGTEQDQLNALRDYLFRMVKSQAEEAAANPPASIQAIAPINSVFITTTQKSPSAYLGGTWKEVAQNASPQLFFWKRIS